MNTKWGVRLRRWAVLTVVVGIALSWTLTPSRAFNREYTINGCGTHGTRVTYFGSEGTAWTHPVANAWLTVMNPTTQDQATTILLQPDDSPMAQVFSVPVPANGGRNAIFVNDVFRRHVNFSTTVKCQTVCGAALTIWNADYTQPRYAPLVTACESDELTNPYGAGQ